jgi:hypothetical protein
MLQERFAREEFGSPNSIRAETLLVNNQVFETLSLSHQENALERTDGRCKCRDCQTRNEPPSRNDPSPGGSSAAS